MITSPFYAGEGGGGDDVCWICVKGAMQVYLCPVADAAAGEDGGPIREKLFRGESAGELVCGGRGGKFWLR